MLPSFVIRCVMSTAPSSSTRSSWAFNSFGKPGRWRRSPVADSICCSVGLVLLERDRCPTACNRPRRRNRIVLYVPELDTVIADLERAHVHFRNAVEAGPGGRQIQLDDPDGNPIELHEAPKS